MATAKKLPSGNWRVQAKVTVDAKVICKSFTAPTKAKAEYAAEQWQTSHIEMRNDTSSYTVAKAIDEYINNNSAILSQSTLTGYRKIKRNYLQDLMDIKLKSLTSNLIQKQINAEAGKYSSKTVRNSYALLSKVISEYDPDFSPKVKLPAKQKLEYSTPSISELKAIIEAVKNTSVELPVMLAILLGMRMSEIRGLKWENVHDKYIAINNAIVDTDNGAVEKGTKTFKSTRTVIIPDQLKKLLKAHRQSDGYVVPLTAAAINRRYKTILKKANVKHFSFHSLRHANASIMLMLNVPDKYAMERGGWSTNDTLKNIYQQTFSEEQKNIAKRLDIFFAKELL